jgi:hypothetical protein
MMVARVLADFRSYRRPVGIANVRIGCLIPQVQVTPHMPGIDVQRGAPLMPCGYGPPSRVPVWPSPEAQKTRIRRCDGQ